MTRTYYDDILRNTCVPPLKPQRLGPARSHTQPSWRLTGELSNRAIARPALFVAVWLASFTPIAAIAADQVSVPVTYVDNRPFVTVAANGHKFRFMIDTGGYDTLDSSVAKILRLKVTPAGTISGAGNGTSKNGTAVLDSLQLGSQTIRHAKVDVIDFSPIAAHLRLKPFDGMIGYDFFSKDVVSFVNSKATFVIGHAVVHGEQVPFSMYGTIPEIEAAINGVDGDFILDTGDRTNATLIGSFVNRHPELRNAIVRSNVVTGWGVGGPVLSDILLLTSIETGSLRSSNLVGRIAIAKRGTFAATDISGTLGNGYLRRFDLSIDYPNHVLYLRPNPDFVQPRCAPGAGSAQIAIPSLDCLISAHR